jgi:hypothetical protein
MTPSTDLLASAKMAVDAGVAERQVANAERLGDLIGELLRRVFGEIQLTAEQQDRMPSVLRRHLTVIAAAK